MLPKGWLVAPNRDPVGWPTVALAPNREVPVWPVLKVDPKIPLPEPSGWLVLAPKLDCPENMPPEEGKVLLVAGGELKSPVLVVGVEPKMPVGAVEVFPISEVLPLLNKPVEVLPKEEAPKLFIVVDWPKEVLGVPKSPVDENIIE